MGDVDGDQYPPPFSLPYRVSRRRISPFPGVKVVGTFPQAGTLPKSSGPLANHQVIVRVSARSDGRDLFRFDSLDLVDDRWTSRRIRSFLPEWNAPGPVR